MAEADRKAGRWCMGPAGEDSPGGRDRRTVLVGEEAGSRPWGAGEESGIRGLCHRNSPDGGYGRGNCRGRCLGEGCTHEEAGRGDRSRQ